MKSLENSCHLASLGFLGFFFESTIVKIKFGLIFVFSFLLAHDRYPYQSYYQWIAIILCHNCDSHKTGKGDKSCGVKSY